MVGVAGVVGGQEDTEPLFDSLLWQENESTFSFRGNSLSVAIAVHEPFATEQPTETEDGVKIWLHGETYGFESESGYTSKHVSHPDASSTEYCAALYHQYGREFVSGLNGEFAGVIYDPDASRVALFTDRLGSRGLFYTTANDGELVFSTKLQSLVAYPGVETEFDLEPLYEWFATDRALGIETPLDGVKQVQPATIATTSTTDPELSPESYWRPVYDPVDRPFADVVDEFTRLLTDVLAERTAEDVEYGLLLSGGSDSRAILAAADVPLDCFTMAGWMSREASIAEKCARESGNEWTLLERDENYQIDALERNPPLSNFVGRFQHAHATGFLEELREDVDVLFSGQFCDTFFKGHFLPIYDFPVDQISSIDVPWERRIDTVDGYVDSIVDADELPEYLRQPPTLREALSKRIEQSANGVVSHGVEYPSVRELVLSSEYYPLTNQPDSFFYDSLVQMMPYRSPFIDNRLIDFHLTVPTEYFLRRDMVNRAVKRLDRSLADIPHSTTGVALSRSFPFQYVGQKFSTVKRRFLPVAEPPAPHLRQTSWTDHKTLIRERDFIEETLGDNADLIEDCSFIDPDAVQDVYDAHLDGEQRMPELYSLVTFLEMPVTRRLLSSESSLE